MARTACHACDAPVEVSGALGRRDTCPACGADLHCCRMCRHYDRHAASGCREPAAEPPRDDDRANFCDFFSLGPGGKDREDEADAAKRAFEALFSKKV